MAGECCMKLQAGRISVQDQLIRNDIHAIIYQFQFTIEKTNAFFFVFR